MTRFEDQLTQSARRLRQADNASLRMPKNPLLHNRAHWGWIATPAAAVAGILFGMSLPLFIGKAEEGVQLVQVHDTIQVPQLVQDTVYLTQVVERERIVWRDRQPDTLPAITPAEDSPVCTSIACDGINYAMLVSQ